MVTTHNLGFPRIGARRELKSALEAGPDLVPVGDFSFHDQVLAMSFMLGNVPAQAGEMAKWFDTNHHYIVPEVAQDTTFTLDASRLLDQLDQARAQGVAAKPVIIGPLTYLWLAKATDGSSRLALLARLLPRLLPAYAELLQRLAAHGADWVQIDEPILATELDADWRQAFVTAYDALEAAPVKLLLATYFGRLGENLDLASRLPVHGLHLDAIRGREDVDALVATWPAERVLSLGVIDGRKVWKTDLHATLEWLDPVHRLLGERLWIAPSCSLLHVPVDLDQEADLDRELRSWLAFALQKLEELQILGTALNRGRVPVQEALVANHAAVESRRRSPRVVDAAAISIYITTDNATAYHASC